MAEINLNELRKVAEAANTIGAMKAMVHPFHATFDPPTVLALLDRVAELEAVVGRVEALLEEAERRPSDWGGLVSTWRVRQAIDGRDPIEILREKLTGGESDE